MKKSKLILGVLATIFLVGCSKAPEAKQVKSNHIQYVLNTEKPAYWHTDADGTNKAKKVGNKYQISVPYRRTSETLKLSNGKDMKKASTYKIAAARPLADYDQFVADYNYNVEWISDDGVDLGEQTVQDMELDPDKEVNEGYHKLINYGGTTIYANYNDGKLLGIRIITLLDNASDSANTSTNSTIAVSRSLGSRFSTVVSALTRSMKNNGETITMKSEGINYRITGSNHSIVICEIYK